MGQRSSPADGAAGRARQCCSYHAAAGTSLRIDALRRDAWSLLQKDLSGIMLAMLVATGQTSRQSMRGPAEDVHIAHLACEPLPEL